LFSSVLSPDDPNALVAVKIAYCVGGSDGFFSKALILLISNFKQVELANHYSKYPPHIVPKKFPVPKAREIKAPIAFLDSASLLGG